MIGWLAKKMGRKALGGAAGKALGVAGVAMKWPFLIAVAVWNILDAVLSLFIKDPLWVFLILILLDALINTILIIMVINGKNIFKLWVWDLILFGWAALSTLLSILAGWWVFDWIIDPLLMVACCFLITLMPFDKAAGKRRYSEEDVSGYDGPFSNKRAAARRGGAYTGGQADNDTNNGVTINIGSVSTDPMRKDKD